MQSPNPKYFMDPDFPKSTDHHTDTGITGLYYKDSDKVRNSDIFKLAVGAKILRDNIGMPTSMENINDSVKTSEITGIYSINGVKQNSLRAGINIVRYTNGIVKKVIK